jgi:rare lipoprotein A
VAAAPRPVVAVEALAPAQGVALSPQATTAAPRFAPPLPPEVTMVGVPATNRIFVQAGAFSNFESANSVRSALSSLGPTAVTTVEVEGRQLYRVRVGPLENAARAETTLGMVIGRGHTDARIVVD